VACTLSCKPLFKSFYSVDGAVGASISTFISHRKINPSLTPNHYIIFLLSHFSSFGYGPCVLHFLFF